MEIVLSIPRETAWKLRSRAFQKNMQNQFDGSVNLNEDSMRFHCTHPMPSQHSPDKEPLSLQVPRTLMGRLKREAKASHTKFPDYVIGYLSQKTNHIVLTSDDYEDIAKATKEAEKSGRRLATKFRFDDPKRA